MRSEIDYIKVGKRIRDARKSMNITQKSLSEICGCTSKHLSSVENGKKNREKAQNDEESTFEHDFRLALTSLEKKLHNVESTEVITKESIKATCLFHDADGCGILIADVGTGAWSPMVWYDRTTVSTLTQEYSSVQNVTGRCESSGQNMGRIMNSRRLCRC